MPSLAEELLLLALHDEKGKIVSAASMSLLYGLAGALLLDLSLMNRISIENKKLILGDDRLTGDEIIDEAIAKIRQSKRTHKPDHWVKKLSGIKNMKDRLLDRLIYQGILRKEEKNVLWVFPSKQYPTVNGKPERDTRALIRAALLEGAAPNERAKMIVSLVVACDLIKEIFPKGERRQAKKRAREIAASDPFGKAVSDAAQAIQAAIIVSVMMVTTT